MKKYLTLLCFLLYSASINTYDRKVYAHSFMYTKPAFYDVVMEQALWHNIAYNKKGSIGGGIQAIPFFQSSMPLKKNARYFLFDGKTELLVAGDDTGFKLTRDVRAEWVNLPSTFSGLLTLNPKQQQKGCWFEYHQDLKSWFDIAILRDMYITTIFVVSETHNSINLRQMDVQNPNTTNPDLPTDILQAFNQPTWCYSRIDNCQKKKVGLAEIRLKIGTSYLSKNAFQLNYYTVIAIPTGNKQNAKTMFEPVNGNNHYLGIGAGVNMQVPLNRDISSYRFCLFVDLESVVLIRNKQFRTYDLFDPGQQQAKPWSRFLLINKKNLNPPVDIAETTNLPGVNFLTQKIYSKPFNVVDFALGFRLGTESLEGEVAYGIWGHPTERTNLNTPITEEFGIAGSGPGKTASRSTIAQQAPDDLDFVPITRFDLDRQTGESSGGFAQRAIASIGYMFKGRSVDTVLGIGGSVDVPFESSLLQLWKVWIKLSLTF
jgi:hypothetical protein